MAQSLSNILVHLTYSSKWMKRQNQVVDDFFWQSGYAAFSVSESNAEQVKSYIDNQ